MASHAARTALLWPTLVVVGALVPFGPVIAGAATLVARDSFRLYEPMRELVVRAVRMGTLPRWNPYEGAGVPLFAQAIHGVLHPVSLITALLPGAGLDAAILLHLVLAALGAYALAQTLGASRAASACAGFAYGLAGYTVSMAGNLVFLAGAASAPWLLAAVRRLAAPSAGPWQLVGAAAAVAVCAFSGEFQTLAWGLALGGVLAADAGGLRGLARAAKGAALGIVIAGVQLLPSWVFLQQCSRSAGVSELDQVQWPLEPWRLVEWIAPGFFVNGGAEPYLLLGGSSKWAAPFAESVFIGGAVLVLAAGGAGRTRTSRILVAAAGVFLWLAFGHRLGAAQVSSAVPIWSAFRYSEKLMAPITLCVAVLCAFGADRITTVGAPRWLVRCASLLLTGCAVAGLLTWLAPARVEGFFGRVGNAPDAQLSTPAPQDAPARTREHLAYGMLHAVVPLAFLTGLLAASRRWRPGWMLPAMAGLVFAQSAAETPLATSLQARLEAEERSPPGVAGPSPAPRILVPFARDSRAEVPRALPLDSRVTLARLGLPSLNVGARLDNISLYSGLVPKRWSNLNGALADGGRWRGYRRFFVTHVVVPPPQGSRDAEIAVAATADGQLAGADRMVGATIWAVPHRPWALFAEAAVALSSPLEVHPRLLAAIDDDDPTVFVESLEPVPSAAGVIRSVERQVERIRIVGETREPSLLVVNDAYSPGWRAAIDGREVEILPADILVRAVRWPAGRHVLEMAYDPPEVRWGIGVTFAGLALLAGLAVLERQGARRRGLRSVTREDP